MAQSAVIMDGKAVGAKVRAEVKDRAAVFRQAHGRAPGLAVVQVGEDPAASGYVRSKRKGGEDAGIASFAHDVPGTTTRLALLALVNQLNSDSRVDGILMQLGRTYLEAGKDADAKQAFDRLTQEFPDSPFSAEAKQVMDGLKKT